ncbi:MAG: hypothetical protein ABIJ08_02210 [Nanoarchaeota archaeon]
MRYIISLIILILLVGCAQQGTVEPTAEAPAAVPQEPVEQVETAPQEPAAAPKQPVVEQPEEMQKEETGTIPADIKSILDKAGSKLTSYSYNYHFPESDLPYKIYIKGNKIKIVLPTIATMPDKSVYNTIYLDAEENTAEAYCVKHVACPPGSTKIADLDYNQEYIQTPFDWTQKITQAEEIDERTVESRPCVVLKTNIGEVTLEKYYGFIYLIDDKRLLQFKDASFNSVDETDVIPSG